MFVISHMAYPFLMVSLLSYLFKIEITNSQYFILILFSILPDFDLLFYQLLPKGFFSNRKMQNNKKIMCPKHHEWFTHWPITYLPIVLFFLIFPSLNTFLMMFGIFSHFILDTVFSGDGMMWFYPKSKRYYNFFSKKTRGHQGVDWLKQYTKTLAFKLEIACFFLAVFIFLKRY